MSDLNIDEDQEHFEQYEEDQEDKEDEEDKENKEIEYDFENDPHSHWCLHENCEGFDSDIFQTSSNVINESHIYHLSWCITPGCQNKREDISEIGYCQSCYHVYDDTFIDVWPISSLVICNVPGCTNYSLTAYETATRPMCYHHYIDWIE